MITKADLEARLELLRKEQADVKATFDAYLGAIQDVQYWLDKVGDDESPSPTEPDSVVSSQD